MLTDFKIYENIISKNYMFVNKIYKRGLIFGDFNFGGLSKITKIGQNYILAPPKKPSYKVYFGVINLH